MIRKNLIIVIILIVSTNLLFGQKNAKQFQNGDLRLALKLPYINWLTFNPEKNRRDTEIGFNGYGIGLEYNYKDKKFIETNVSFAMTFELPFPAPIDAEYNKILISSYINLTDNFVLNRFTIGYGINYSINTWREWTRDLTSEPPKPTTRKEFSNRKIGIALNSYYRLGKSFNIGLIYQPNIYNISENKFNYEHLLALELNWRIKLMNLKRK